MTTIGTLAADTNMLKRTRDAGNEFSHARRGRVDLEVEPDGGLLELCAARQAPALEELVRRYQSKLYLFLYRMIGSTEDTEEAVLDVFVRVWQQCGRFEGRSSVATWIYRIAANIALDTKRRRRSRPQTLPFEEEDRLSAAEGSVESEALNRLQQVERSKVMDRALQTLSGGDRLILVLYYVEELDYDEIREIMQCSYPVLKTRLMRARQRLRTAIEAIGSEAMI